MKIFLHKAPLASALSPLLALAILLGGAVSALADVKAGVDAWTQGDYDKAVHEWVPLAQAGDPDAQFNLGQAYKLGRGVPADLGRALDYYRQAALQGHDRAEDNYGLLLFQQNRRVEALPYLEHSAERGEPRAQYLLGVALFNGDLGPKDWPRAYALMTQAAKTRLPQATASLAQMNNYIPEDQRLKGLALAEQMDKQLAAKFAPFIPAAPAATTPAPATPVPAINAAMGANSGSVATPAVVPGRELPTPLKSVDVAPSTPAPVTPVAATPAATPAPAASEPAPARTAPVEAGPVETPRPADANPTKATSRQAAPAPAPIALRPAAQGKGKWRVQLGAFTQRGGAEKQWKILSARVRDLAGFQHDIEQAGPVIRLLAGPLASQQDANRLCAQVRASGNGCMVKPL